MGAMRNHWDGSSHDPYLHANPQEPFRPIALLRTGMGHGADAWPAGLGCSEQAFRWSWTTETAQPPINYPPIPLAPPSARSHGAAPGGQRARRAVRHPVCRARHARALAICAPLQGPAGRPPAAPTDVRHRRGAAERCLSLLALPPPPSPRLPGGGSVVLDGRQAARLVGRQHDSCMPSPRLRWALTSDSPTLSNQRRTGPSWRRPSRRPLWPGSGRWSGSSAPSSSGHTLALRKRGTQRRQRICWSPSPTAWLAKQGRLSTAWRSARPARWACLGGRPTLRG